jgi:ADP-ribosylglycohydrolase
MTVEKATKDMIKTVGKLFSGASEIGVFTDLMSRAVALAKAKCTDSHAIDQLGEGWIGEEALAISVFCAIRYSEDFEGALIASVNHRGDSDSTGAITGNILGASLGASAIPEKFKKDLELFELTKTLAEELLESNVNIAK